MIGIVAALRRCAAGGHRCSVLSSQRRGPRAPSRRFHTYTKDDGNPQHDCGSLMRVHRLRQLLPGATIVKRVCRKRCRCGRSRHSPNTQTAYSGPTHSMSSTTMDFTTAKLLILGVTVYFWPAMCLKLARMWASTEFLGDSAAQHEERLSALRQRFWRGSWWSFIMVGLVILGLLASGHSQMNTNSAFWIRAIAALALLTGALGRGGWHIQSWSGDTIAEKIDRGMYVISQLGGTGLLIIAFTL